jgi:hypothetical protein
VTSPARSWSGRGIKFDIIVLSDSKSSRILSLIPCICPRKSYLLPNSYSFLPEFFADLSFLLFCCNCLVHTWGFNDCHCFFPSENICLRHIFLSVSLLYGKVFLEVKLREKEDGKFRLGIFLSILSGCTSIWDIILCLIKIGSNFL